MKGFRVLALAALIASAGVARAANTAIEYGHILACQYTSSTHPADGAINNVWGAPTWIVPGENAVVAWVLHRGGYTAQARRTADYLARIQNRSEEHTSELQSLAYLVCRLLL